MSQWEIKISSLFPILAFFFRDSLAQSTGVGKWQDNNCYFCYHRLTDKLFFLSTSENSPSYYPLAQLHQNAVINSNGQHWNYLWWAACTPPTDCIGTTLMDSLYPSTSDLEINSFLNVNVSKMFLTSNQIVLVHENFHLLSSIILSPFVQVDGCFEDPTS